MTRLIPNVHVPRVGSVHFHHWTTEPAHVRRWRSSRRKEGIRRTHSAGGAGWRRATRDGTNCWLIPNGKDKEQTGGTS